MALRLLFSFAMALRSLRLIFTLLFITLGLAACGKGFVAKGVSENKTMTGARNKEGQSYTRASDTDDLEALKHAVDPSLKQNLELAASIESVVVARLDLAGNTVTSEPAQLEIRIALHGAKPSPLVFHAVFSATGGAREARAITAKDDSQNFKLNVRCLETDCSSTDIRLSSSTAEAGFIHRIRVVKAEALGPFGDGPKPVNLVVIGQTLMTASAPLMLTTEVAWGPAIFELTAGDLTMSGDLIATGGDESNVSVKIKNQSPIEGRLVGNSNRGDILVRLSEGTSWSFVRLTVAKSSKGSDSGSGTNVDGPVVDDTTPLSQRFVPFDTNNPFTRTLQSDFNRPEIQALIPEFKTKWGMSAYLSRLLPNLPVLLEGLKSKKLPPELIFITLIESRFFSEAGFPIPASSTGAVGPWQFMPRTAQGLGLSIKTNRLVPAAGKRKAYWVGDRCDDRANVTLATRAAAKYLRYLLDLFPNDPRLAVMAYNGGEGNIGKEAICGNDRTCRANYKPTKLVERLRNAQTANFNYWTVRDFNMAPKESIVYVARFIAAQFVAREPSQYGITFKTTGYPVAPATCH